MNNRVFAGRYRITEKIGTGGMAEVFKAQDETLGRSVAVKTMLPQYAADPTFAARFRQEAQAAANLSSPYIVNIYDWGKDQDTYYIVMEYVRGVDLKTAIVQRGAINQRKVAEIGSQVCSALSVAHGYDIIHRDIKPHNIMVQPDGNSKVMDFGIARAGNASLTQTSSVLGTAHYVSPEQAQGKKIGPQSDLYSLGVVLYEAATGQLPFDAPDAVAVAMKQVNEPPVPPSQINPDIDPVFEKIILHAMEKRPEDRFSSANEMKAALNNYLAGRPVNFGEPETATSILTGNMEPIAAAGATTTVMDPAPTESYSSPYGVQENRFVRAEDQRKEKKKWPIVAAIIGVIAAIAIIIVAIFALSTCGSNLVSVPSVEGMSRSQAETTLLASGFEVGNITEENSDTVSIGNVISQDPAGKTKAEKGATVNLVISTGPKEAAKINVPDLTGMTASQAEQALTAAGFVPQSGEGEYSDTVPAGKVMKQNPATGTMVAKGSTVTYILSLGVEGIEVPDVTGMTRATAKTTLENAGFQVNVDEEYSTSVESGKVIRQDPDPGQKLVGGSSISITISLGEQPKQTVSAPNLIGMTYAQAQVTCDHNLLELVWPSDDPNHTGTVATQTPAAGTTIDTYDQMRVTVSGSTPAGGAAAGGGGA